MQYKERSGLSGRFHALSLSRFTRPVYLCLICFFIQLLTFWPGIADYDTVNIYEQLDAKTLGNWHPPIFAVLWSCLLHILPGTSGPFLLQLILFWIGMTVLVLPLSRFSSARSPYLVLAAAFIPMVFGFETTVIKDAHVTSAMLGASGLWGAAILRQGRPGPLAWLGIVILLAYAILVRSNAIFAVLPLGICIGASLGRGKNRAYGAIGAALTAISLFLLAPLVNASIFRAEEEHPERQIALYDLAGIAHFAPLPTMAGVAPADWRRAEAKGCYQAFYWDPYGNDDWCPWIFEAVFEREAIWRDWITSIARYPVPYARHRLAHFNVTMRWWIPLGQPRSASWARSSENGYGLGVEQNPATFFSRGVQIVAGYTPLGWPACWLALAVSLFSLAIRDHDLRARLLVIALLLSAMGIMTSFLVISIASDLRYHHWAITAIGLSTALFLAERPPTWRLATLLFTFPLIIAMGGVIARIGLTPAWPE